MQTDLLTSLTEIIEARKSAEAGTSYVASLFAEGLEAIAAKVHEEADEAVQAAKSGDRNQVVYETADLWFHSMIMLSLFNATHEDVLNELERRFGVSGLVEKQSRQTSSKH